MALALIDISLIDHGTRLRTVSEAQVESLMESIAEVGLLNPITVYERPVVRGNNTVAGYGIIAGAHRKVACDRLGLIEIEANVVGLSELQRQIAECDENLRGPQLGKSDLAMFTRRRKEAYEALHPEVRAGAVRAAAMNAALGNNVDANLAPTFTADTAAATGRSERAVQRDAERGEKIATDVLDQIRGTHLDSGRYLDDLKKLDHGAQRDRVGQALAISAKQASEHRRAVKIDGDVKARAAREVADIIAEYVPGEAWDGVKANLYAAGAKNIGDALVNITGQTIMDRRYGT